MPTRKGLRHPVRCGADGSQRIAQFIARAAEALKMHGAAAALAAVAPVQGLHLLPAQGGTPIALDGIVTASRTLPRLGLTDPNGPWPSSAGTGAAASAAVAGAPAPQADLHADFTGDTCLRTNLVTKRLLDGAAPGQVLEIISDNLSSVETIPFMLEGHGCQHLATVHHGNHWRIYARKRPLPPR